MKKLLTALVGICAFTMAAYAASGQDWDAALQKGIELNQRLGACTPGEVEYGPTIIGITNKNECHYQTFFEFNGQKSLYQDCYVPMSVLKKYTDSKIAELKQGKLSASSSDPINQYCKTKPQTIQFNN